MIKVKYFSTDISKKKCSDAGMAAVLIMLLIGLFTKKIIFYQIGIPMLVINMIVPLVFYPFAILWYGLSGLMGDILSRIILTIVYIVVVLPVGFIRKLAGKDPLKLRDFKKADSSVMIIRDHLYTSSDLEKPF
jgi:uncharacterized membrane protein